MLGGTCTRAAVSCSAAIAILVAGCASRAELDEHDTRSQRNRPHADASTGSQDAESIPRAPVPEAGDASPPLADAALPEEPDELDAAALPRGPRADAAFMDGAASEMGGASEKMEGVHDSGPEPLADAAGEASDEDGGVPGPTADAATGEPPVQPDDDLLFTEDTALEVALTVAPEDFQRIRHEGRTLNEVFSYCLDPAFEYSTVPAAVAVADRVFANVGLRKKGFIGSLSSFKPAMRVKLDEYVDDQELSGTDTLVLNNSLQDPSFTHTCMAYALFRAAGVAAPRCGFAHVRVNDEDFGIYVLVEPIKKAFLARHFGDDSGDLYEGNGMSDFRADMLGQFEKKTNEAQPVSWQLTRLTEVLERSDDGILTEIEALVDLDQFMRFWATEALVAHWDGYSGNLNNFYLYVHPVTQKLVFIPWGTDAAFEHVHPYVRKQSRPKSVFAWARLPHRLYAIERSRERFRATLRALLQDHWNEADLLAEVDRIAGLVAGYADPAQLEAQRAFIRNRRAELLLELDGAAPAWAIPERPAMLCQPERNSPVHGSFRTTWGDLNAYAPAAENVLEVTLDEMPRTFSGVFASAGLDGEGTPTIQVGAPLPDGRLVAARFMLRELPSEPGEVLLHGFETYGAVVRGRSENEYALDGFIGAGKLVFDQVSPASGAPLVGRFEGQLITLEPALAAQYGRP